jgi:16S rRNA processing protein RimM
VKLVAAIIERPHGVYGEFQASIVSDTPNVLLALKSIYVGDEVAPRAVLSARMHQDRIVFKIDGINNPEQVRKLSKIPLRLPGSATAPLAEGEYFYYQLIDSTVVDESGNELGTLVDIMETGANQVYVIRGAAGTEEILLPNIPSVVLTIDIESAKIVVRMPEYY